MKKGLILLLSICFFLTSCNDFNLFPKEETPFHYGILQDVYDSMKYEPVKALTMLEEFSQLPDFNDMKKSEFYEYHILLAEARYKCDLNYINDIEIYQASSYLDSLSNIYPKNKELQFQNSRAYYYKGVIEEENETYKEAFICFLKSLSLIEHIKHYNERKDEIIHFKGLVNVRLSDILYWLDAYEASIDCLNNANNYFSYSNNQYAIIRNNIMIAMMHGHIYNYEKTFRHLSIADSILDIYDKNSPYQHVIERIYASIMYNIGYQEESFKIMLKQFNTLEEPNLKMEAAGVLGDMYYSKGIFDSAIYYYEHYFPDNKFSKIDAANHIIEISLKIGNNDLITKYAPVLTKETKDELQLSIVKTELSSLYKQYVNEKERHSIIKTILIYLSIILTTTLLFFIFGMFLLGIKRRKYNSEIEKKNFYINSLQEKFEKKTCENKHIRQKIKSLENEIQDIKTKRQLTYIPLDMKIKEIIEANDLCRRLVKITQDESIKTNIEYPELILKENERQELINIFNSALNNALNKIIAEYKGLNHNDSLYFCLYLIGMDEKHISAVTGKTYNIIYNRTKKMKESFGIDKSIREIIRNRILLFNI